jgi:hypothetical protein
LRRRRGDGRQDRAVHGRGLRRPRRGALPPARGNTVNVLPAPGSLSSTISPPSSWTRLRLMERPRPVPPYWREVVPSAWAKASNTLLCRSA